MAGNLKDPMVGRDVLLGGLLGTLHTGAIAFGAILSRWLGFHSPPPLMSNVQTLGSVRTMLASFLNSDVVASVFVGFAFLFFLLLLYIILRKQWLAVIALFFTVLVIEIAAFASAAPNFFWIASLLISLVLVTVVTRLGLLATMAAQLFFFLTAFYPMTTDFSVWYAPAGGFALVVVVGLSIYGFYTSLGAQPAFGDRITRLTGE